MLRFLRRKSAPTPSAASPDAELLTAFRADPGPERLLPLYERHAEFIYALALRYLGTPPRAEDAGMEIWTVLLEKLPQHEVTNFRGWLATTVRNHCLMQLRREKRDPLQHNDGELVQSDRFWHPDEEDATPDTRPLYRCLNQLREEQRTCVRLFYLQEGQSYQSIADQLGLTVGRVRSHLQNGRRNLKICLESQNAELPRP